MSKKKSYCAKLKETDPVKFLEYRKKKYEYEKKYCEDHPGYKLRYYHKTKNKPEYVKHYLLKHAKARAVQKGLEFSLTEEHISLPELCPILGIKFARGKHGTSYSLDRIDPTKGYTPDNVWVISQLANSMKWNSTAEHRQAFAKWIMSGERRS